ncbi:P-loop containing nucleoside triphosphate hydrolase protein [Delphinella strobiligena]|nr:P-loop containing nucleoside triphosphate hydrolase protein [Delphinella strobiligena]
MLTTRNTAMLDKYFRTREASPRGTVVTFDTLWIAFPPGVLVYGKPFADKHQLFISAGEEGWPHQDAKERRFYCWIYDWNGTEFLRRTLYVTIEKFEGQKPLTSLLFYPFELHKDCKTIESILVERGKKFRDLCMAKQGNRMFDYRGDAIAGKRGFTGIRNQNDKSTKQVQDTSSSMTMSPLINPSKPEKLSKCQVESTVMVDYESYSQYGPQDAPLGSIITGEYDDLICGCNDCKDSERLAEECRFYFDGKKGHEDWTAEQFMLCPPRVLGYILGTKQWAQLHIGNLQSSESRYHQDTWDNKLQLAGEGSGSNTKNLLMNLVKSHGDPLVQNKLQDIVAEKGRGLVILLHGPPGVGKTSTAETMALAAGKPLFSVTVADVGTQASNVEANLQIIFKLANTWGAILLIDEADVFLESRLKGPGSLTEKNALVSVFLRVLEYYKGILILTRNQISQFDVAVQSRVHVAIKYEQLDKRQTMAIFEQFLGQLDDKGLVSKIEDIREYLDEDVCKLRFDGRQIRNIMTSAVGLVHAKGKNQLTKSDIKEVVSIVKDFKDEYARQFDKFLDQQKSGRRQ